MSYTFDNFSSLTEHCEAAVLMGNMNLQNAVVPRKRKHRHEERAVFQLIWDIFQMAQNPRFKYLFSDLILKYLYSLLF